jgi:hypothetical protein
VGEASRRAGGIAARTNGNVKGAAASLDCASRLRACRIWTDSGGDTNHRRERNRAQLPYFHDFYPSKYSPEG